MEGSPVEVLVGRGARAVEARLLAEVADWRRAVREDPARLARPLVVLVPSKSLKQHVSATLVREIGTLAGVAVQTHHATALQILERAGRRPPTGAELVPVLVRQLARGAAGLTALDALVDGHGAVSAVVSDLLDAGLDENTADAVRDFFAEAQADERGESFRRGAGLVEVALAVRSELRRLGMGRVADVIAEAREALEADPGQFTAGRLVLHGFADTTGIVTDFLRALQAGRPTAVLLDRPPDPAEPGRADLGVAFTRRFELAMAAGAAETALPEAPPAALSFFRAPGTDAELREVARRILARREAGTAWEAMAVVTRTPALYASALRVQFGRLGIPFSGVGLSGPRSAAGRRSAFLIDLLRQGERLPADRFVTALEGMGPTRRDDLRLGLHALGVARLGDLAGLDVERALAGKERFPLPVRRGLATGGDGAAEPEDGAHSDPAAAEAAAPDAKPAPIGPHAARRALYRDTLEEGIARAARAGRFLAGAEEPVPIGGRLRALAALAREALGWGKSAATAPLVARLDALADELPAALPVRIDELALVLDRALARGAHAPLGGAGGGVQVLDVVEARARTFEQLFLLGLNRDQFPRIVADDPLLPDEVRVELQELLQELPVKERGHDEERFLFAQLVSASADVTISWQVLGDDGKAKAPSPLVERLLPPGDDGQPELVPTLLVPPEPDGAGRFAPRPAHEWALLAGLQAGRQAAAPLLPAAIEEVGGAGAAEQAAALGEIRARVIAEADAYRRGDPLLGPYFGHVGRAVDAADLRHGALWVTTVEQIARCPWRGFLTRMLRIERPPDALEALPEATPLLQGSLVHAVLERIVREVIDDASDPQRLHQGMPVPVPWPQPEQLRAWTEEEARRVLFEEGIGVPGFAELLAEQMLPYLEAARIADWADGPVPVVGVEIPASVEVATPGATRTLHFRADRVDRVPGGLRITDYKTGKTLKDVRNDDKRRAGFREKIAAGLSLQAPAYAQLAAGAEGRLLFVKPEVTDDSRVFRVGADPDDADLQGAFEGAVGRVLAAVDEGTFVPRFVDPAGGEEPASCKWCEVSLACLRGDSGARRRLADWSAEGGPGADPRGRALRGIWEIGGGDDD